DIHFEDVGDGGLQIVENAGQPAHGSLDHLSRIRALPRRSEERNIFRFRRWMKLGLSVDIGNSDGMKMKLLGKRLPGDPGKAARRRVECMHGRGERLDRAKVE